MLSTSSSHFQVNQTKIITENKNAVQFTARKSSTHTSDNLFSLSVFARQNLKIIRVSIR